MLGKALEVYEYSQHTRTKGLHSLCQVSDGVRWMAISGAPRVFWQIVAGRTGWDRNIVWRTVTHS